MKKYPKNDKSKHWDLFYNEIKAMKNFKHPNILKLITYSEDAVAVKSDGSKVEVIYKKYLIIIFHIIFLISINY